MVKCSECGLLAFTDFHSKRVREATPKEREAGLTWYQGIAGAEPYDRIAGPVCSVGKRTFKYESGPALVEELGSDYPCGEHYQFLPGMSPVETRMLQMEERTTVLNERIDSLRHRQTLLCSVIVALAASILTAFLTWLITSKDPPIVQPIIIRESDGK